MVLIALLFGVYRLNANRVVPTVREPDQEGFTSGTLSRHTVRSAERFLIVRSTNGKVTFDLHQFTGNCDHAYGAAVGVSQRIVLQRTLANV